MAILNSAMSSNNPFTMPIIQKNVGTIPTEVYAINNQRGQNVAFSFEGSINGEKYPFEIMRDINQNNVFKKQIRCLSPIRFLYRNDKKGLDSFKTLDSFFCAL